jgi:hypothetical protein
MSYKPEVQTDSSGKWYSNAARFATLEEADAYNLDLAWRWTAVRESRVIESDEPVNFRWDWISRKGILLSVPSQCEGTL